MTDVNVLEQTPAGGNVSEPSSGTYGDVKSLNDLRAALPGTNPAEPRATQPAPLPPGPKAQPQASGLPAALLAPSRQPGLPASTPLASPASAAPLGSPQERRIQFLDAVLKAPDVSTETKEWAQTTLNWLVRQPGA